jgi:hypothetical protein
VVIGEQRTENLRTMCLSLLTPKVLPETIRMTLEVTASEIKQEFEEETHAPFVALSADVTV